MKTTLIRIAGLIAMLAFWTNVASAQTTTAPTAHYVITPLPLPPGFSGPAVVAINDMGQVVGYATGPGGIGYGILWSGGQATVFPGLGGDRIYPQGINSHGAVAGYAIVRPVGATYPPQHSFIWSSTAGIADLGISSAGVPDMAVGVDNGGNVAGNAYYLDQDGYAIGSSPYTWRAGAWSYVPAPGFVVSALNPSTGNLVGNIDTQPALYSGKNGLIMLQSPPGGGVPLAVNANNEAVGHISRYSDQGPAHWATDGSVSALPLPASLPNWPWYYRAKGINDNGEIVGNVPAFGIALYWATPSTAAIDLNSILSPGQAALWQLTDANAINNQGQIAGIAIYNGAWTPYIMTPPQPVPTLETTSVSRDNPSAAWADNWLAAPSATPLYAGDGPGDLVGWRVKDAPTGASFQWFAAQTAGLKNQTIVGPQGTAASQWTIADGSLNWPPGTYSIGCTVTAPNGTTTVVSTTQVIGWRTQEYFVVGQVKDIQDFSVSSARQTQVVRSLINSYRLNDTLLERGVRNLLQALPVEQNLEIWLGWQYAYYDHFDPSHTSTPNVADLPGVSISEKYWIMQSALDAYPDLVNLPDVLDESTIINLLTERSYRMYSRVQFKYRLSPDGAIDQSSIVPIRPQWDNGPTKGPALPSVLTPTGTFNVNGLVVSLTGNSTQSLISSEASPDSGKVSSNATNASFYMAGRVGPEGRVPTYALIQRDAPFIFTEIIAGMGPDGRDTNSRIRLSVDTVWSANGAVTGTTHFNEVRIYKRDYTDTLRRFVRDPLGFFPIKGQLSGFLQSGSPTWPGLPPPPSIR